MIRSQNPKLDVVALKAKCAAEAAAGEEPEKNRRLIRLSASAHVRTIESSLDRAEERSTTRTHWPAEVNIFPFSGNAALQRFALRLIGLLFRDQHEVNAQLIRAQRESLALLHDLLERVHELESRLEIERATARADRIARRNEHDG